MVSQSSPGILLSDDLQHPSDHVTHGGLWGLCGSHSPPLRTDYFHQIAWTREEHLSVNGTSLKLWLNPLTACCYCLIKHFQPVKHIRKDFVSTQTLVAWSKNTCALHLLLLLVIYKTKMLWYHVLTLTSIAVPSIQMLFCQYLLYKPYRYNYLSDELCSG